jgi:hypothetical protein
MKKQPHLAVHGYGTGGIWVVVNARSPEEITKKYPELQVFEKWPPFMTQLKYDDIAAKMTFDIDDKPSGWLAELVKERDH